MAKSNNASTSASASASNSKSGTPQPAWRPTTMMNMRDLSRDDDFLSAMLIESLGTGDEPLTVHKMDTARAVPAFDPAEVLAIVHKHIVLKPPERGGNRVRHAVDALLTLPAVKTYLRGKQERQRNAFATHASRYFELYLPGGSVEIAHTTRYSHRTGKSELCILATRPLAAGTIITDLKGSLADLSPAEDESLRKKVGAGIRRDFSVIYSRHKQASHLFLGPARFVNHDCSHNVELFRDGRYITFKVVKPIEQGQEITAHYGNSYFGRKNKDCLCETCEKAGTGAYAPRVEGVDDVSESDISESSEIDRSRRFWDQAEEEGRQNLHVRKTRRGTYAVDARHASTSASVEPSSAAVAAAAAAVIDVAEDTSATSTTVAPTPTPAPAESEVTPLSELSTLPDDEREATPVLDPVPRFVPPPMPPPGERVDFDTYKPDSLTAHFPPLVRVKDAEAIARLVLRRDDLNAHYGTRGLPRPDAHALLEDAAERGRYPPEKAFEREQVHFLVSPALVDAKSTTFDFFDCGALQFPHPLVQLDVKSKIAEMVLLRADLSRRSDWRGLPWPEWSPALVAAQKAGRYPKFPSIEQRGPEPVYYASRAFVEGWWGIPRPLAPPLPVGHDVPDAQLLFVVEAEWVHIAAHPERYLLDETCEWGGLPWPETHPAMLRATRVKQYPVFPEIDDRGAPPRLRPDRTYALFERRLRDRLIISNDTFVHTTEGYALLGVEATTYEIPHATWDAIRVRPDDFGLNAQSDWRGLPWPESSPVLADAVSRGTYPVFPPIHLRGQQPRSRWGFFTVFDHVFRIVDPDEREKRASTASTAVATPSPSKKRAAGKGKEKDDVPTPVKVKEWWDDGQPRCPTCKNIHRGRLAVAGPNVDCIRCRRHLLIYGSPWPKRTPPPGTRFRSPTPSEDEQTVEEDEDEPEPVPTPAQRRKSAGDHKPSPAPIAVKKRAAPEPAAEPIQKRRRLTREERLAARTKAREEAEREHAAIAQAYRLFREQKREEALARRGSLLAAPSPDFYAKRRAARDEEELARVQERVAERSARQRVLWRMPKRLGGAALAGLGGLGVGARNPMYFARRRADLMQVACDIQNALDEVDVNMLEDWDDDADMEGRHATPPPPPLLRDEPSPVQATVMRIPVPPWMEDPDPGTDADDEDSAPSHPTLVVRVVS